MKITRNCFRKKGIKNGEQAYADEMIIKLEKRKRRRRSEQEDVGAKILVFPFGEWKAINYVEEAASIMICKNPPARSP